MSDFTAEQIAADRDINGRATTEPLEVYLDTCGVAGCDEHNVRGLAAGNHGMFEHKGDAEFFVNARTRFPLALDEIERLQRLNSLNEWVMQNAGRSVDVLDSAGMGKRISRGNCLIDMAQEAAETIKDLCAENAAMSEALAKAPARTKKRTTTAGASTASLLRRICTEWRRRRC